MSGNKRDASDTEQTPSKQHTFSSSEDKRTLVCAVRGLHGQVCTITISADASIHSLKELIHRQNASQLTSVTPTAITVYSSEGPNHVWAVLDENGTMVERGKPSAEALLLPTRRIRYYFPSTIPAFDSGVVHVVADIPPQKTLPLQVKTPILVRNPPLRDDNPTQLPNYEIDEYLEEEIERCWRVREALGLFVHWSIKGTDFSQKHNFPGAQWLEYKTYDQSCIELMISRVFIGDKTTWRDLYVACNKVVQNCEGRVGSRYVEAFYRSKDGTTLELDIGT
ncbi:hypothetical protein PHMEG_0001095 [Phytophthora megakarya]|uniref:Crinkler effector protein N-terminal domain-containing protein n=1 Tax=Phytophthora megakarya TaxID=4795 RepID=A0A225X239_9STRA|nr:hypothetical protein PHMEG_0001095 [Phytophthora megakarya]